MVQVNGDNVRVACLADQLGEQPGGNGAPLSLLGLLSIGQVGQNANDVLCRRRLASVAHQQHLHDAVIDVGVGGRLDDVNIARANGIRNGDQRFAVGRPEDGDVSLLQAKRRADGVGQLRMGVPGEDDDFIGRRRHYREETREEEDRLNTPKHWAENGFF